MPTEATQGSIIHRPEISARTIQAGRTLTDMKAVPRLAISRDMHEARLYDPDRTYSLRYRSKNHQQLHHLVKFSDGRSRELLLFALPV